MNGQKFALRVPEIPWSCCKIQRSASSQTEVPKILHEFTWVYVALRPFASREKLETGVLSVVDVPSLLWDYQQPAAFFSKISGDWSMRYWTLRKGHLHYHVQDLNIQSRLQHLIVVCTVYLAPQLTHGWQQFRAKHQCLMDLDKIHYNDLTATSLMVRIHDSYPHGWP